MAKNRLPAKSRRGGHAAKSAQGSLGFSEAPGAGIDIAEMKRHAEESRRIRAVEFALQLGVQGSDEDQDITLLERAKAIEEYLRDGKIPEYAEENEDPAAAG